MALVLHPEARVELREAAHYYDRHKPGLGRRFLDAVEAAWERVQQNPERFRLVEADVRKCKVLRFPYGVFCQCKGEDLRIVAIAHVKRHPDYWKHRVQS